MAEKIVDELLKVNVSNRAGETVMGPGEFIEPIILQLVCATLWKTLPADVEIITMEHLRLFGDVDQILAKVYEQSVEIAVRKTKVKEINLRKWFDRTLITEGGTRGMVYREQEKTGGIQNSAVFELECMHIIRGVWCAGGLWYELIHDRFIEPIRESNKRWFTKH